MTASGESGALPAGALAVVSQRWPSGEPREMTYLLHDEVVAIRQLDEAGRLEQHSTRRGGVPHGPELSWDGDGHLRSVVPHVDGLEHGRAVQWDTAGREIGSYQMNHGTGVDLWRAVRPDGSVYLSEVRYLVTGERHGFEWILADDQRSVSREKRFAAGLEHGIGREWTTDGRLELGSPRFYLLGRPVEMEDYEIARAIDPALPEYRLNDDQPLRSFPALVADQLALQEPS